MVIIAETVPPKSYTNKKNSSVTANKKDNNKTTSKPGNPILPSETLVNFNFMSFLSILCLQKVFIKKLSYLQIIIFHLK